jgi:hypothetical protein
MFSGAKASQATQRKIVYPKNTDPCLEFYMLFTSQQSASGGKTHNGLGESAPAALSLARHCQPNDGWASPCARRMVGIAAAVQSVHAGDSAQSAHTLARRRSPDAVVQGQLDVGEFEYDGALPAFRASVYGLESGAGDLLITQKTTYLLLGPHRAPTRCLSLGPRLRVPSTQWLESDAICVGEAPLAGQAVQWWHKSGFDVARYWFTAKSRVPWRSLFVKRTLDPAVIGDYAMTYFPAFTPLPDRNLSARCKTSARENPNLTAGRLQCELLGLPYDALISRGFIPSECGACRCRGFRSYRCGFCVWDKRGTA